MKLRILFILLILFFSINQSKAVDTEFYTPKAKTLIVFVHGFWGNNQDTWNNEHHKFYFPKEIFTDKALLKNLGQFDVVSFGYQSECRMPGFSINSIATKLYEKLYNLYVKRHYRSIKIIAHSMGGIVVKKMLLSKYEDEAIKKIDTVINLGTPHWGGNFFASLFLKLNNLSCMKNAQTNDLDGSDGSYLDNLNDEWRMKYYSNNLGFLKIYAAGVEGKDTSVIGNRIVEKYSATAFCSSSSTFNLNHVELSKPSSSFDDIYKFISDLLIKGSSRIGLSPAQERSMRNGFYDMKKISSIESYKKIIELQDLNKDEEALAILRSQILKSKYYYSANPEGLRQVIFSAYFASSGNFEKAKVMLYPKALDREKLVNEYKEAMKPFPAFRRLSSEIDEFKTNFDDLNLSVL